MPGRFPSDVRLRTIIDQAFRYIEHTRLFLEAHPLGKAPHGTRLSSARDTCLDGLREVLDDPGVVAPFAWPEAVVAALKEVVRLAEDLGSWSCPMGVISLGGGSCFPEDEFEPVRERQALAEFEEAVKTLERVLPDAPASGTEGEHARDTPPEPVSPGLSQEDSSGSKRDPPVILGGLDDEPLVFGRRKKRLTPGQYRVVKVLVDAYPERVSLDVLANRSDTSDPVGMIDRLRKCDDDWACVLFKPGRSHGGYGLEDRKPSRKKTPRNPPRNPPRKT
jgi:hypothetical protein